MKRRVIRTSDDLLDWKSSLAHDPAWAKFAAEFDDHVEDRLKAARAVRPPAKPSSVRELENLCSWILHGEMVGLLPCIGDDGAEQWQSPKEIREKRLGDACKLAERVEDLLAGSEVGKQLLVEIQTERKRLEFQPDDRNTVDAFRGLMRFIGRVGRLPFKRDLNWEVNRMKKCNTLHIQDQVPKFDDPVTRIVTIPDGKHMVDQKVVFHVYTWEVTD